MGFFCLKFVCRCIGGTKIKSPSTLSWKALHNKQFYV